jgi:hypothetical protein
VGHDERRVEADGGLELVFRFLELTLLEQESAEAIVEIGLVRMTTQKASVGLDGPILLSRLDVKPGEERSSFGVIRLFPEVVLQKSDRTRIVTLVLESPHLGKLGLRSSGRGESDPNEASAREHELIILVPER